jgi:hypothetical protein
LGFGDVDRKAAFDRLAQVAQQFVHRLALGTTKANRAVLGFIAPSRRIRSQAGRQRGCDRLVEYGGAVMRP